MKKDEQRVSIERKLRVNQRVGVLRVYALAGEGVLGQRLTCAAQRYEVSKSTEKTENDGSGAHRIRNGSTKGEGPSTEAPHGRACQRRKDGTSDRSSRDARGRL